MGCCPYKCIQSLYSWSAMVLAALVLSPGESVEYMPQDRQTDRHRQTDRQTDRAVFYVYCMLWMQPASESVLLSITLA